MKKLAAVMLICFLGVFSLSSFAAPQTTESNVAQKRAAHQTVTLHFFWSKDCPHCVAAHPFINKLKAQYPGLKVAEYEISDHPRNSQLFEKMAKDHGRATSFVPTFFIGDKMIVGYTSADTTGAEIRSAVDEAFNKK